MQNMYKIIISMQNFKAFEISISVWIFPVDGMQKMVQVLARLSSLLSLYHFQHQNYVPRTSTQKVPNISQVEDSYLLAQYQSIALDYHATPVMTKQFSCLVKYWNFHKIRNGNLVIKAFGRILFFTIYYIFFVNLLF